VIIGDQEMASHRAGVRDMRTGEQADVAFTEVPDYLRERVGHE